MAIDPLTAGLEAATTIINKIWPDKSEQEKQELAATVTLIAGQLDINKEEAKNPSIFVSGWRPFVGWVCAGGMCYSFIGQPLLGWVSNIYHYPLPPSLDTGTLLTVLGGLLGLGGMRTVEKINGVAAK